MREDNSIVFFADPKNNNHNHLESNKWYYKTNDGPEEGPFDSETDAIRAILRNCPTCED